MTSKLASNHGSKEHSSTGARRRGVGPSAFYLAAALALTASACTSDDKKTGNAGDGSTGTDAEFESCLANVQSLCITHDQDTAAKMQVPCKAIQFIPIPLTDGTQYGPKTIDAGPYASKLDWNQGAGTAYVNQVNMTSETTICDPTGIDTFMEPAAATADLKNLRGLDPTLYTIFRPACMKKGETYPVISWANGTCGYPHGYAPLLDTIASYGYVIIASNSVWTDTAPSDGVQERAIDYAEYLNEDTTSPLYHRLDLTKVGAMGHSQGAAATIKAAADSRVKSVIFWNYGTTNDKPFLTVSGDHDVMSPTIDTISALADISTQPAEWIFFHQILQTGGNTTGHLVLMEQPDRVWKMAVDYWDWQLKGNEEAKKTFVGSDCGLCTTPDQYDYGVNSVLSGIPRPSDAGSPKGGSPEAGSPEAGSPEAGSR